MIHIAEGVVLVIGVVGSLFGIWSGWLSWDDWNRSRRLDSLPAFPLTIRRAITFSQYVIALNRFERLLKDSRWHPDVVVGIHYGGVASAADVARRFYKPVYKITVKFDDSGGSPECVKVWPEFTHASVKGKDILLVDNRVKTGKTMEMSKDLLHSMGARSVRTLVVFRASDRSYKCDYLFFSGKGNIRHLLR